MRSSMDSLGQSLGIYKTYFGENCPAIAHIYKSMARVHTKAGDYVCAAVRGGEAGIAMVTGGGMQADKPGGGFGQWAD